MKYLRIRLVALVALSSYCAGLSAAEGDFSPENMALAASLFKSNCAQCHESGDADQHAPKKLVLYYMSPGKIYRALTSGPMQAMAQGLSLDQRRLIAEYLTGRELSSASEPPAPLQCRHDRNWFDYKQPPLASGWGMSNTQNTRFIPGEIARLSASDVKRLKIKWSFAFPNTDTPRSQPAVGGGTIYVGDQDGDIYALDAKTGCAHWHFKAGNDVRTAISIGSWDSKRKPNKPPLIYFGDASAFAYGVNAVTGELVWKTKVEDHPLARITGSPTLQQTKAGSARLYVPVSSLEEGMAANPGYSCCTFRGSVSAVDADNGSVIWKAYSIPNPPTERFKNAGGIAQFGPSGAGIWNSPTLDERRGRLYVGTGENDVSPAENGGAVLAIDLKDGAIAWVFQGYPQEAYNGSCRSADRANCPREFRGRYGLDVSPSPMLLRDKNGKELLVAGQKTGDLYGLDPDNAGRVVWRRRITRGDFNLEGVFGMAAEDNKIFAGVFDFKRNPQEGSYWGIEELGLYAVDGFTGAPLWRAPVAEHCSSKDQPCRGYSAALTAVPGMLFAGAVDGYFRAFDSNTGALLWEFNTAQKFTTLNGEIASGGDMDGPGAVVVNGMVYVNSGYATGNSAQRPGNVFLAFSIDGK